MSNANPSKVMNSYMPLFGLLIIFNALVLSFWVILTGKVVGTGPVASTISVCLVAVFVGIVLILQDRALEVTIKNVGSIKAAAEQAVVDAQQIREMARQIEAQRATVDLVAKEATDAKLKSEETARKNEEASTKLKQIDQTLKRSEETVSSLKELSEFSRTVLAAQNDDRTAFDMLRSWSDEHSYTFNREATAAVKALVDKHSDSMWTTYTVEWNPDPAKMNFEQLKGHFSSGGLVPEVKQALIDHISNREDISKSVRMEFLVSVLSESPSLDVVACAGRNFAKLAGTKVKPIAVREHLVWWENNKRTIK